MIVYYAIHVYARWDDIIKQLFELNCSIGEILEDKRIIHTYQPGYWIELIEDDSEIRITLIDVKVECEYRLNLSQI